MLLQFSPNGTCYLFALHDFSFKALVRLSHPGQHIPFPICLKLSFQPQNTRHQVIIYPGNSGGYMPLRALFKLPPQSSAGPKAISRFETGFYVRSFVNLYRLMVFPETLLSSTGIPTFGSFTGESCFYLFLK